MVMFRRAAGTDKWSGECRLTCTRSAHAEPDRYTILHEVTCRGLQCGEALTTDVHAWRRYRPRVHVGGV
jgi:hypothetical protein